MSLSAIAFNSVDLPDPFFPTSAYRRPALSRSFALDRTSVPSGALVALALPLAPAALLVPAPDVTVRLSPSMSSCQSCSVIISGCGREVAPATQLTGPFFRLARIRIGQDPYLSVIGAFYVEASLLAGHENGRHGLGCHGRHLEC